MRSAPRPVAGLPGDGGWEQYETEWEIRRLTAENGGGAPGWELPDDMTAKSFFSHPVHKGVFHQRPETVTCRCPIPSLRTRLIEYSACPSLSRLLKSRGMAPALANPDPGPATTRRTLPACLMTPRGRPTPARLGL